MVEPPEPEGSFESQVAALRESAGAFAVGDAVVRVAGADRGTWLAGMVTNDTKSLGTGRSCYTAIVQVKGKLITDAWVHVREGDVLLLVHPSAAATLVEHLERYVVMDDVEVGALPDARVVSVQGPRAAALLAECATGSFAADRLARGGRDFVLTSAEEADALQATLAAAGVPVVSEAAWEAARIEAAVPRFGVDFGADNFVQEANIQGRAVSTRKGCYVGQEVVCRLEVRGHVKRQLAALVADEGGLERGAPVRWHGGEVGAVTSAAFSPALGRGVAIAMLKADAARPDERVDVGGRGASVVARPVA